MRNLASVRMRLYVEFEGDEGRNVTMMLGQRDTQTNSSLYIRFKVNHRRSTQYMRETKVSLSEIFKSVSLSKR